MYNYTQWVMNEGGWTSKKTQGVRLTPAVIQAADAYVKELFLAFEKWLKKNLPDTAPLRAIRPVGSGIYYEQDLDDNPDKVYGDVDYLIEYPVYGDSIDIRKTETNAVRFYNKTLFDFLKETHYKGIDFNDSKGADGGGGVLIAEVLPNTYIQIDLIVTHAQYTDWAMDRFTPIRNVKGFVSGTLYSSLASVLTISMGDRGARAKLRNGALVPFNQRKDVEEIAISLNFKSLFSDIVKFFLSLKDKDAKASFTATDIPGINVKNLSIANIAQGINSLVDVLDRHGLLDGKTISFTSAAAMKRAIAETYAKSMNDVRNDSKFAKAEDPMAIAARDKVFKLTRDTESEVATLLG